MPATREHNTSDVVRGPQIIPLMPVWGPDATWIRSVNDNVSEFTGRNPWSKIEYRPVLRRLARFRDVSQEAAQCACDTLLMWSRQVHESGGSLPAPRVFGNDEGLVEFEWHLPTRQLFVTLVSPNCAKVIRLKQTDGVETEKELQTDTTKVARHLLWVLGS